jgi:hypothetical protein
MTGANGRIKGWSPGNAGPAARMLPWDLNDVHQMLIRAGHALRACGLIDALDDAGAGEQFLDVLAHQGMDRETRVTLGQCVLGYISSQAFALVVVTPAPATKARFDRTDDDRIIVPAAWIQAKVQALADNALALPRVRDLTRELLESPIIRDVVLPADIETVAVEFTDVTGAVMTVEALPGGCVIAVMAESHNG